MGANPWESRLSREHLSITLDQLPSSFYWGRILEQQFKITRLNELMNITMPKGILFAGPEGNGKHTIAEALLEFLLTKKTEPFSAYICVNGAELDGESPQEVLTNVDTLLRLSERCGRICILLENVDACRHGDKVQIFLARRLMRLKQTGSRPWFLILISEKESDIHPQLRRQLQVCPCPNPDRESRRIWLEQSLKTPIVIPVHGLNMEKLVEATDQFSWHQLTDFYQYLKVLLKVRLVESIPKDNRELALKQGKVSVNMSDVLQLADMVCGRGETVQQIQPLIQYVQALPNDTVLQEQSPIGAAQSSKEITDPVRSDHEYIDRLKNADKMDLHGLRAEMTLL